MIDWSSLAGNTLWILGCAAALATISHASWQASARKEKLSSMLSLPAYQLALVLAAILFCLGMSWVASNFVEIILWLLIAAGFTAYGGYLIYQTRSKG